VITKTRFMRASLSVLRESEQPKVYPEEELDGHTLFLLK
jgi:hypothetical protein